MGQYWKRIVVAGVGAELVYAIYIYFIASSTQVAYAPTGFATVFVLFVLGGLWLGRPIPGTANRLFAGVLAGVAGTIFYYVLQIPDMLAGEQTYPLIALFNHGLKLAGGAIGALLAGLPAFQKR